MLLGVLLFAFFLSFASWGIFGGDSGDLVTAGYLLGVPHPPGYPLFTLLTFLFTRIPLGTPAFWASALSSLCHAAAAAIACHLGARLTGTRWAGVFAALLLAGNYVFFLYGVTPEVFALFDLFVLALAALVLEIAERPHPRTLGMLFFVFGLSLSHHHLVLFLLPGIAYVLWQKRARIRWRLRYLWLFLLGLTPYLYIPFAAARQTIISWNSARDVAGFVRLVTRADYGTFRSGAIFAEGLAERLVQVGAYVRFVLLDFGWVGAGLAVAGAVFLWRKKPLFFRFVLLSIVLLGPAYFFYASFPLVNRFMLGTYERFLLPSYVLLAVLAACGAAAVSAIVRKKALQQVIAVALFSLPVLLIATTVYRFWGLPQDRTANRLGEDVLATIPQSGASMLFLSRDTTLFATQYVRYALGTRPDVPVIAFGQLGDERYRQLVAKNFPTFVLPGSGAGVLSELLTRNAPHARLFTNAEIPIPEGWTLVPYGLVYEILPEEDAPESEEIRRANEDLWAGYQNPALGILARYNHLMLSDVRDVYATARLALGKAYVRADEISWARDEFQKAVDLGGDISSADAYAYLGLSELWLGRCSEAIAAFARSREQRYVTAPELRLYESVTYQDCVGDEMAARELYARYEREREESELPLESL